MKDIIKTLILTNSVYKWENYYNQFHSFYGDRDPLFDETVELIQSFYDQFNMFPTWDTIKAKLEAESDSKLQSYLAEIINHPDMKAIEDDQAFISHLSSKETVLFGMDLVREIQMFNAKCQALEKKGNTELSDEVEAHIAKLYEIRDKVLRDLGNNSSTLYGRDAGDDQIELYDNLLIKKANDEHVYFDVGVTPLENVHMKLGDLVFAGAYTSHGKSIYLRQITYRLLMEYGLNCVFFSFEMSHDNTKQLFYILHANNKEIFPNTPDIPSNAFKKGELTEEERDFLENQVMPDFNLNENYGTLTLIQPNNTSYNLEDMEMDMKKVERKMPVHVCSVDYITLMNPMSHASNRMAQVNDYNEMIKKFKNMALSHRNVRGSWNLT